MIAIAIDGPSGAGKSTIAKEVAKEHGFTYIDTGALYRAIAYFVTESEIPLEDEEMIVKSLAEITLDLKWETDGQHVYVSGVDVTDKIRTPEVSMAASKVSAIPKVREYLLGIQRGIAERSNVIMDGRDIGTVILPKAQIKIFLTASPEDRARRRYEEHLQRGDAVTYEKILAEVKERDYNDSTRATAPLKAAPDAITVDTTGNTLEQSISQLSMLIRNRLRRI